VKQYDYNGKLLREIQLPAVGTAGGFRGKKKRESVYSFTNYTTPGTIYSFEPKAGISSYAKPKVDFKSDDFESSILYFKDGTKSNDYYL
jgi:prolyl oligopeptidase